MSKQGYRGELSAAQAAEGSAAALNNSKRLLSDADLLFAAGSKPTAVALAVLATEEVTKTRMIWLVAAAKTDDARRAAWDELRNHRFKHSPLLHITRLRVETAFDELKQRGFYVDAGEDEQGLYWMEPDGGRFDSDLGRGIMNVASCIVERARAYSQREIELWAEQFSFDLGEDASAKLSLWEAAMESEGFDPHS